MMTPRWMVGAAAALAAGAAMGGPWLDFDAAGGAGGWRSPGDAVAIEVAEPPTAARTDGDLAPAGRALRIRGDKAGTALLETPPVPAAITNACFLRFRALRVAPENTPLEAEARFIEPDNRSLFWRKFALDQPGWQTVELPLRFFRTTGARLPTWSPDLRFALHWRGAGELWVDNVELVPADGCGPYLDLVELRRIAFPEAPTGSVRLARTAEYALMTDSADLDIPMARAVLEMLTRDLRGHVPFLPPPARPVALLVFAEEADYRKFPPLLAERLNSTAAPPTNDGFTVLGVATSFWSPEKGSLRPVFFHEFVHAWLAQAGGLACEGHWLHEAVANWYQLKFFPQTNFDALVRREIERGAARPLRELCGDAPVKITDYWQLVALYRMFVGREPYAGRLPRLFQAARAHSSFDLHRYLNEAFGVDWPRLESDWRAFCAETFGAAPP